ncbi:hypothetical protein ACF09L_03785 [Streptomyces sp. NPDC014779]|uniref:hypothetical protein n=1 Tax=Streptomyces sp. NPDC014779 TaxID=3364911 RepID=UPI0036FB902A
MSVITVTPAVRVRAGSDGGRPYEALRKDDQTTLFAGYALIAAVGGGLTLVFAQLDARSDER